MLWLQGVCVTDRTLEMLIKWAFPALQAELADYKRLKEIGIPLPEMLDVDLEKEQIVKEYIAGDTVFDMVLKECMPDTCLEQSKEMCRLLY